MRRFVVLLLLLVPSFASDLPIAKPEAAGMSTQRLERIGVWLRDLVERKQAAGFVTLVARHGKIVQHQAYGTRGLDSAEPMPVNALFDLAAMTKPVTVMLGYLVQQVSGQPLDRFVQERVLSPLGMSDTHYWPPPEKDKRRKITSAT